MADLNLDTPMPGIGQVQWHGSDEDGGPDVGILIGLSADHHLWLGERSNSEGGGMGMLVYGPTSILATASLSEYDELREVLEQYVAPALASAAAVPAAAERFRHVKRGTEYAVVGRASLQNAGAVALSEAACMVIYRGDDGKLWAREESEFMDGRFEPVAVSPEPVPATNQAGEVATDIDALNALDAWAETHCADHDPDYIAKDDVVRYLAALATQPATSQEAIEAGKVVLEGRGDGTYAEAEQAIRSLIAHIEKPATSQEGEDEDVIHDCGNLGWCQAPGYCSRHGTAATPTPPTLSEDLRALVEIEKFGHGDGHGRGYTCADMAAAALARAQVPQ